ncbi:MAG: hypothetical protein ABIK09_00215 [Pseudomonadota bacterium]
MKDFGGRVHRDEDSPGRSKKAVIAVITVICLAVAIAWIAQGRVDREPEAPADERLVKAAAKIQPSLDPSGEISQRYPGSPWERRNNMLQEIVDIVEGGGDPYDLSEEVRNYVRGISKAVDASCAEVLSNLGRDAVIWSGVVSHAGEIQERLLRRFDQAVAPWPEENRTSLRGVKPLFACR